MEQADFIFMVFYIWCNGRGIRPDDTLHAVVKIGSDMVKEDRRQDKR